MTFWRCQKITDGAARPGRRVCALAPAIIAAAILIYAPTPAHALLSNGEPAIDILGQFSSVSSDTSPVYTKGCPNNGASAIGFNFGSRGNGQFGGGVVDATNHRLFWADSLNNRVLVFPLTTGNLISSKTPSYVLGQSNFTTCAANAGGSTSASVMSNPNAPAFDPVNNRLFVADTGNNRVLVFNTSTISNGMSASYVLGQTNFTNNIANQPSLVTSRAGLNNPYGVQYDSTNGRLFVLDYFNNRVMVFNVATGTIANGENASYVLGQSSFTTSTQTTTQSGLAGPLAIAYDSPDTLLYVADAANQRVVTFNVASGTIADGENASYVLGTTNFTSTGSFSYPDGVAYDATNQRVFVANSNIPIVQVFTTSSITNGESATYTLGTGVTGATQNELNGPGGLAYDSTNSILYVTDTNNNRVMEFNVVVGATLSSPSQSGKDACAIGGGQLYCWGLNNDGEDGTGNSTEYELPVQIGTATNWTAVSQGDSTFDPAACGIAGGALYCWGENTYGEAGQGNTTPYNTPQLVSSVVSGSNAIFVTSTSYTGNLGGVAGANADCAARATAAGLSGTYLAWISDGTSSPSSTFTQSTVPYEEVNGTVIANNWSGLISGTLINAINITELGTISANPNIWTNVAGSGGTAETSGSSATGNCAAWTNATSSDSGNYGYTARTNSNWTWDGNQACNLTASLVCVQQNGGATATPPSSWTVISQSGNDACGIDNGNLYCWGRNEYGELGQGNTIQQTSPVQITSPSETWSTVSTGGTDTCAITTAGALYCWGRNNEGQDGIGSTSQQTTPQQVASPSTTWASVSQGSDDTCAITTGGALYCWGYNRYGEDGQGNTTQYSTPQATGTSISTTGWTAVTAQYDGTNDGEACGIAGGALYCWGRNHRGEGGIGSTTQTTSPAQVGSATNWSSVSFGDYDTCGVAGTQLYCWGYNHQYEDGVGNTTENTSPVAVGSGFIGTDENAIDELGEYNSPSSIATVLWTANGANNGPTALGIDGPSGTALDTANHYLYVVDSSNNRVLVYTLNVDNSIPTSSGGHTASYVLGQTSLQGASVYGDSMSQLNYPSGVAFDPVNQRLFVSDYGNARVLAYNVSGGVTNGMSASNYVGGCYGATQACLAANIGIAYDAVNSRLFVAEANNSRVMVFNVAPGFSNGENASYVLGQPNFTSGSANQGGSPAQNTLNEPNDVAYDPVNSRLFVGDDQQRVMVFNVAPGTIATNENASYVIGEPDFITTNCPGSPQSCVSGSSGLGYDPNNNRLFVASIYNDTVLVFNVAPGQISNGMNASYELGCTSFGTNCYGTTQSNLLNPGRVFYDPGSGRLFVGDGGNNRVIIFDATFGSPNFLMMMPD